MTSVRRMHPKMRFIGVNIPHFTIVTICVYLVVEISTVKSANVLMIHPVVSRSHELMFVTLGEALVNRGHNVTLVRFKGHSAPDTKLLNVITLEIRTRGEKVPYILENGVVDPPHDLLWNSPRSFRSIPLDIITPVTFACETLLANDTINIFKQMEQFDLAIVDLLFNECGMALAHHLGLPTAAYWPTFPGMGETFWTSSFMSPSIFPVCFTEYTNKMNLWQRFVNTAYYIGSRTFAYFIMVDSMCDVIDKYLPRTPHPTRLIHNISLFMINSDFTLDFPRPITPNTLYVGCLQCRDPKPLPEDIEEYMQSSGEDGVIVFSLGASFSEEGMPHEAVEKIYKAFARCKQKFILKMAENSPSLPLPKNVRVFKWLPQQDILAHPNTRLFITHCGMHGVLEAIYHGVPMVGIPLFGDQGDILVRLKLKGVVVSLEKSDLTEDTLYNAIQEVLNNKSYYTNVKKLSKVMRDQPQTPMEKTLFWIEYIIRHNGAEHLKTADRHLNIIQYLLLDVIVFYMCLFAAIIMVGKWVIINLSSIVQFGIKSNRAAHVNDKIKYQ